MSVKDLTETKEVIELVNKIKILIEGTEGLKTNDLALDLVAAGDWFVGKIEEDEKDDYYSSGYDDNYSSSY